MGLLGRLSCPSLLDMATGDRAIGADVLRIMLSHLPEHGPADFHGIGKVFAFYAPGAVVPGAASTTVTFVPAPSAKDLFVSARYSARASGRGYGTKPFYRDFLKSVFNRPSRFRIARYSKGSSIALATAFTSSSSGKNERQFLFVHERAGRHRGEYCITFLASVASGGIFLSLSSFTACRVAQFQLRHSTTGFFFHQPHRNLVMVQYLQ